MTDPREVARPFAPPDHTGPGGALDPRAPLQLGDRVAWVRPDSRPRPRRMQGRPVESLGVIVMLGKNIVTVEFDEADTVTGRLHATVPIDEVYPRPGR